MSVSFQQLLNSIYTLTNRPDLIAESTQALINAINIEHNAMDYPKDLTISAVIALTQADPNNFRYNLSTQTLGIYPNCKKIISIAEVQPNNIKPDYLTFKGYYGNIVFNRTNIDNIFDQYGVEKFNYYYEFNNQMNLVATREVDNISIAYYARPIVNTANTDTYSDWLADMYDYLLYEQAAANVLKWIGKDEEAAQLSKKAITMNPAMPSPNRMTVINNEILQDNT